VHIGARWQVRAGRAAAACVRRRTPTVRFLPLPHVASFLCPMTVRFLPLPRPPLAVQRGEDGRSAGRGVSACCDSRVRLACLHGCAHSSRASHAALLQRWPLRQSSLQCHCTPRVPSTDAASSRAVVVGRVQSITKAQVVQACIDIGLDLCAAHTRLHAPFCCDGMIAPFIVECKPVARNGPHSVQAPCLHPPESPLSPRTRLDPHRGHPRLVCTATRSALPQKWCYFAPYLPLPSRCTFGRWRRMLPA